MAGRRSDEYTGARMHPGIVTILEAVRRVGPDLAAYKSLGQIYAAREGDMLLFNYTARATYERAWNAVERVCRGLIVHWPSATLAALPFEKFFNLGELPETALSVLPPGPIEVTAKLDGSLGILYRADNGARVATRGSFVSAQAQWATAHLRRRYDLRDLPDDLTLLWEIIYPGNRVVLNYGAQADLYLLGARRISDGSDLEHDAVAALAEQYGFPLVPRVPVMTVADLLPLAEEATGIEGWVVRWPSGLRVKIKTMEYLALHRLLSNLTPSTVRDALLAGTWEAYLLALPEEFAAEARALAAIISHRLDVAEERVATTYRSLVARGDAHSRKAFALAVQEDADRPYLFKLLDGKPIRELLLRDLDLRDLAGSARLSAA